jgi:HEAT repeat protein
MRIGKMFSFVILPSFLALGWNSTQNLPAQIPRDHAWQVLQEGVKDKDAHTRAIAIRSLGLVPQDRDAERLAIEALKDTVTEVRVAAASSLGQMRARNSIPALQEALKDNDVSVIVAAASSLRALGDTAAFLVYYAILTGERKSGQGLADQQKKMFSDPKKMAQMGFDVGIGFIPFAGMGLGAVKTLTQDDESPIRAAAAVALAKDPDPKSGQALLTATQDKSWIVRAAALDAIAQRDDPACVSEIVMALSDAKPEVKYTAAAAVYRLTSGRRANAGY